MDHLRIRTKATAVHNGIIRLSLIGKGRNSTIVAIAAPTIAARGETNSRAPTKAKKNPAAEPSRLLSLLKGKLVFEKALPKMEAALSPNAKAAIAA